MKKVANPIPSKGFCACGRLLHYSTPELQRAVEELIEKYSENIDVTCNGITYSVPRHYIALHGIKGHELPEYGFKIKFPTREKSYDGK